MKKSLLSNSYVISFAKKFNVILFGVITTALINRYLGPAGKGEYAYILSIVNILVIIFNMGINQTYPFFKRKNENESLPVFFTLSLFNFIVLFLSSIFLGIVVENINIFFIFLLTAFSVFRMQLNYFNLVENIKSHSIITIISSLINCLLVVLVFMLTEGDLIIALLLYLSKDLMLLLLTLFNLKIGINKLNFNIKVWIEILKFGFIPMYTTLLISINYKIDIILLEFFDVSFLLIGLYTVGLSLAEYAWMLPDIFKDVMINKTAKKDDIKNMSFSLRISSTLMVIIYLFILLFGKQIILILFGSVFQNAYSVTILLFLGVYSMTYCKIIGTLYIANGNWGFYAKILTIAVVLNIVMNVLLIPNFDIYGAAGTTIISYTFAGLSFLIHFKNQYSLRFSDLIFIKKDDIKLICGLIYKNK